MKIIRIARLPLLTLALLATLVVTSSAFAATPTAKKTLTRSFSSYHSSEGMCSGMMASYSAADD